MKPAVTMANSPAVMDAARADPFFVDVKAELTARLHVSPGMRIVEVGCGTGEDTIGMATALAGHGLALGVDVAEHMVEASLRRAAAIDAAVFVQADAAALPLRSGSMDGWRTERVLQHLPDPLAALEEAYRVVRPDGRVVIAEPDWEGVLLRPSDEVGLTALAGWMRKSAQPAIGRSLPGLLERAGFTLSHLEMRGAVYRGLPQAMQVFPFKAAIEAAVTAGTVSGDAGAGWLDTLTRADAVGEFLFAVPLFIVAAERR